MYKFVYSTGTAFRKGIQSQSPTLCLVSLSVVDYRIAMTCDISESWKARRLQEKLAGMRKGLMDANR